MSDCEWDEGDSCTAAQVTSNSNGFVGHSAGRGRFSNTSENVENSGWNSKGRGRGMFGGDGKNSNKYGADDFSSRKRNNQECYKCHQDGHFAKDCPSAQDNGSETFGSGENFARKGRDSKGCFKCHQDGHFARECPNSQDTSNSFGNNGFSSRKENSKECFKCHEEGHFSRDCPNSQDNSSGFGNNKFSSRKENSKECFKCHEEGHFSRDCPNSQNEDGNGRSNGSSKKRSGCFKCNEEGHIAANCDKPIEEQKGGEKGEGKPPPVTYVPEDMGEDELFKSGISIGSNFSAYDNVPVKVSGSGEIASKINDFPDANLRNLLLENVVKAGYKKPTPIQKHSIPVIMSGRDLMACAQTGSGKTAAYLLPILHSIIENNASACSFETPVKPIALILAPTRELAIQIYNEARKFAMGSILKICITYGGTSVSFQNNRLQKGSHVLVATCGRLNDFVERGAVAFDELKYLVLDEADRMLDLGFKQDIEKLVSHRTMPKKEERQTLMFSATFATAVQQLAKMFLNEYVFIVTGLVGSANVDVRQTILSIERTEKRDSLLEFLKDELSQNDKQKIIVFVETKRMADFIALYLSDNEMNCTSIHGDRFQSQREQALNEFKAGIRNILVATAVAARGLDIRGVGIVINYDMPKNIDEYVHRIGRTGRVGNSGRAVSYFEIGQDSHLAKDIVKMLKEAEQEVPEFLYTCEDADVSSYREQSRFGATDMRRSGISTEEYPAARAVGGPLEACGEIPNDEETWD